MGLFVPASRSLGQRKSWTGDAQFGTTTGTLLTASATPHALPAAPTEVVASTAIEADWIEIQIHGMAAPATLTNALCNIYIGAASSETLLIDSLQAGWSPVVTTNDPPYRYWFPIRIPQGTRISASLRALIASDTARVLVKVGNSNRAHWSGSGVETLGEDTASSRGTAVTPATSAPTWATIGTTGRRYRHIVLGIQGNNDTTAVTVFTQWSIGTGSAVLQNLDDIVASLASAEYWTWTNTGRECDIPSGTSLQLRSWSSSAPSGAVYATLHGVY